jgi:hypothetical protein
MSLLVNSLLFFPASCCLPSVIVSILFLFAMGPEEGSRSYARFLNRQAVDDSLFV